jgi:adenosylmethionine---8-amino-7-oxononanoate aminotransferase
MTTSDLEELDKKHLWHPFTQMRDWCAPDHAPLVIERGSGARLWDRDGREFIDGNASIWTNVHGHNHPAINEAIATQLQKIAHTSFLGATNEPAIRLAAELVSLFPPDTLTRVFYADNGSTAIECALKMALQFWQLSGHPQRREWVAFDQAYHGDTLGAASLGGLPVFGGGFAKLGLSVHRVANPHALERLALDQIERTAAVVIEPLVQGAAGMRLWPRGMLQAVRDWCDRTGALLIFDEVMTGFGRTGTLFAFEQEGVLPDILCLAKGLSGGYMPLGATLATERLFSAFLGRFDELKTFFYGHSYCGHPLACAAARASLRIFADENVLERLQPKIALLGELLAGVNTACPQHLGAIRQCGFIAGIDLVKNAATGESFDWRDQTGARFCFAARQFGLLTRPIRDTVVLMPPLCATEADLVIAVTALANTCRQFWKHD